MKSPAEVVAAVTKALTRNWADWVLDDDPERWPHSYPIGTPNRQALIDHYDTYRGTVIAWNDWAAAHTGWPCRVLFTQRPVGRLRLDFPTHLDIDSLDTAARIAGDPWPKKLGTARTRADTVTATLLTAVTPPLLKRITSLSDVDFTLLCEAVTWLKGNDCTGLTARQVPIPGIHAKWIDQHHSLLLTLLGRNALNLRDRPQRIDLTYLDPTWRAAGNRLRDSLATDDPNAHIAYRPDVIIVTENRDTALFFPETIGGISIEGSGKAILRRITQFDWFTQCDRILYWGDIDADGYEILARLRQIHPQVTSLLMDLDTYTRYASFGTRTDRHNKPIAQVRDPSALTQAEQHLTPAERAVYALLRDPHHNGPLRIEQERIPLSDAAASLQH